MDKAVLVEEQLKGASDLESQGARDVEVSVVIPCLNEANSIGVCVDKAIDAFRNFGIRGEVLSPYRLADHPVTPKGPSAD